MAARRPLVLVSGLTSELPDGDSVVGISAGSVTAGSGLDGGGDVSNNIRLDVRLAPNPSGIIYVGSGDSATFGLDGSAQASGNAALSVSVTALASGNSALVVGSQALSSGNAGLASGIAALSLASTALASGNAGINTALTAVGLANSAQGTALIALASGNAGISVGLTALASGNAGISVGLTALATGTAALASGNAALSAVANSTYTYTLTSGSKTLSVGERTAVISNNLRISLPLTPSVGNFVSVGTAIGVNNTTLSGNGANIMQLNENLVLDVDNTNVKLAYFGTSLGWRFV